MPGPARCLLRGPRPNVLWQVDEDFNVWLLEVNVNPALHTNSEVLERVITPKVARTMDIVLEVGPVRPLPNHHVARRHAPCVPRVPARECACLPRPTRALFTHTLPCVRARSVLCVGV